MRDPGRLISVLRYWKECPDRALRFANTTGVQAPILVLGHSHNAGRWRRENRTILNTGAFGFPGSPYAVVLDDRGVALQAVERTDQGYSWRKSRTGRCMDAIRAQASGLIVPEFAVAAALASASARISARYARRSIVPTTATTMVKSRPANKSTSVAG